MKPQVQHYYFRVITLTMKIKSPKSNESFAVSASKPIYAFNAWCPLKSHTYFNKPAAFS